MKQAYLADAVAGVPVSTGAPSVGNPSDGDPANAIQATALGAYAPCIRYLRSLRTSSIQGGLTPDIDVLTQLRDAVQAMIDASAGLDTAAGDARYLRRGQNLGDVNNSGTSRGNIGAAPINSPTFTGNPRSVTPAANDSDTSIATTAFVGDAVATIIAAGSDIDLATRNEHLSSNPPTNEAAVPAYVADMIEVLESAVNTAIALKSNIASPTFTGDPRSSDPPSTSNNTRIATTNWVRDRVTALIGGAPGALDTLNELAEALGDDDDLAGTLTSLITALTTRVTTLESEGMIE